VAIRRVVVVFLVAGGRALAADKLDDESRKWLEGVAAIVLPEETRTYRQLKDRAERAEFEKIFWARRDPDLRTSDNEAQREFLARKHQADERFKVKGLTGSASGCGRLLILLGEPDLVQHAGAGTPFGNAPPSSMSASGAERSSATQMERFPGRHPEVWIYRNRQDVRFPGGEAHINVDSRCAVEPLVFANFERVASGRIRNPGLAYKVSEGRITPLADLLPRPTPSQEMLARGSSDLAVAGQFGYFRADGATAVIGLVRVDAAGLTVKAAATKSAQLTIAAEAVDEEGQVAAVDERTVVAPVDASGAVVVGCRLFLRPGRYTLRYGGLDAKTGKGGTASETLEVPDLNGLDLSTGSLVLAQDVVEGAQADVRDPLDPFVLGSLRLVPRFGNRFARAEPAHFFFTVNGSVDQKTGQADLAVALSLLKGTTVIASTPEQFFREAHVVTSVGPVPLNFEPGAYRARLRVKDKLAGKEATVEQAFEIR